MASVRIVPKSPFYMADMRIWIPCATHRKGGYWKTTTLSTKVPNTEPEVDALKVANEMEAIRREARGSKIPTKQFFQSRVASLMNAAGVDAPFKQASWKEFSGRWLSELTVSHASLVKYTGEVKQFSDFLGAKAKEDMRTIAPEEMAEFHAKLIAEGRTAGTARNTCKSIRAIFARAILMNYLEENPAALLKLKSGTTSSRQPFTLEDLQAISNVLHSSESPKMKDWRTACHFGLYYGMRIGDAVSRDRSEIRIENGVKVIRFTPEKKKAKGQEIALPLIGELAGLEAGEGPITPTLLTYNQPTKGFSTILEHSGIFIKRKAAKGKGRATGDKSFHSFRHTANSLLAAAGVDSRIRQLICDHDDESMNARYTHASVKTMADAIARSTGNVRL